MGVKLSQNTEWVVLALLIAYIAFLPPLPMIRDALATSVGKALALGGIVYVWKCVSAPIAILLVIAYMRCAKSNIWEMFSGAESSCTCEQPDIYTWDATTRKCTDKDGKEGTVYSCVCTSGYAWDGGPKGSKQCVPVTDQQPPLPPLATNPIAEAVGPKTMESAAPAMSMGPVTSTAPMTTPGAAADMAANAVPPPSAMGGVQPGATTTSSTPATL